MSEGKSVELPVARSRRYASLDACRGIACLFVVIHHSTQYAATKEFGEQLASGEIPGSLTTWLIWQTSRLWIGVPIFFAISGYCISAAADDHRQKNRPMSSYFWRRFWRIYPPYWICLAMTCLLLLVAARTLPPGPLTEEINLAPMPSTLSLEQWVGNLTLTESWRYHVTPAKERMILAQSWTLCFEEQFYMLIGLILCVAPKKLFQALLVITLIIWANTVANFNVWAHGGNWNAFKFVRPGTFFSGEWLQFAAGVGVYYFRIHAGRWAKVGILAALFYLTLANLFPLSSLGNTQRVDLVVIFFAFLLIAGEPWDLRVAKSWGGRFFGAFGKISYSMYLVHYPMVNVIAHLLHRAGWSSPQATLLLTIPLCVMASSVLAMVFYHCVERHFLNTKPTVAVPA